MRFNKIKSQNDISSLNSTRMNPEGIEFESQVQTVKQTELVSHHSRPS